MTNTAPNVANRSRLSLLTQITPAAWRLITAAGLPGSRIDLAALQPQPLPPVEDVIAALNPQPLPPLESFQLAAAVMTHEFARLAIQADIHGRSGAQIISDMVDDWCLTGWPLKWPIPIPDPVPPRPNETILPPQLTQHGRMVGALVLANIGSRLGSTELSEAMLHGAERLDATLAA